MVFPTVQGENLEGRVFTLPTDLEGTYNLLFIAFKREQQADIDSWLPLVKQLVKEYPALAYYELPTIYRSHPLFRWWVNTGMRMGIPDRKAREVTITLYLDKPAFRKALALHDEARIYVLLVNSKGDVFWQAEGPFTEEKGQGLRHALESQVV